MNKIKALIQWFMQLELKYHRHWCVNKNCWHTSSCWYCNGIFCKSIERKNCPGCEIDIPCAGRLYHYGPCSCEYGTEHRTND